MKIQKLKEKLSEIHDPRRQWGNLLHKLWEVVVIALLTVISCGEDYDDMEEFGKEREEWLKSELGLELEHGIADGDTIMRIFRRIKPTELRTKLNESIEYIKELREIINIDGKTKRASGVKSKKKHPIHIISAFASENQLVLGEIASENKQTEIKEIPKLLDTIDVSGGIVTIDAIGMYQDITAKVIEKEADYEWAGLNSVGMVKSVIEKNGEPSFEFRYYATSLTDVNEFAYAVRKHWSIENQLHWCLDVVFREDSSKAGKDNSAMNLNILTKHALHLITKADLGKFPKMGKPSKKRKRFKAALNPDVLIAILLGE